jgi:hypothetical protein
VAGLEDLLPSSVWRSFLPKGKESVSPVSNAPGSPEELLTMAEIAAILKMEPATIRNWI